MILDCCSPAGLALQQYVLDLCRRCPLFSSRSNHSTQTLTVLYHITHQKINIRKETSTSINVFSIASYISMVTLLIHMLKYQPDYPTMPLVTNARQVYTETRKLAVQVKGAIEKAEL